MGHYDDQEGTCEMCWRTDIWVMNGLCDRCRSMWVSSHLNVFPVMVESSEWRGI